MTAVVVLAAMSLAAVAAAGVVRPFGRRASGPFESADPLDDERAGLLQALRDLDQDHLSGQLSDEDYRALRWEREVRAVAVLRALQARDGNGELGADLRDLRPSSPQRREGRSIRVVLLLVAGLILAAIVGPVLADAARERGPDQTITGGGSDPLSFFRSRVADHPKDVAARLDLADAYLRGGNAEGAIAQYLEVLTLDPDNAEARATLGFLLYQAGKAEEGLREVDRALQASPQDPEALYFRGVILLEGLDRPTEAAAAFEAYLAAAPFGARRAEVQRLLDQARSGGGT
jgi:tetratricopeptide (TPR) repeat protein